MKKKLTLKEQYELVVDYWATETMRFWRTATKSEKFGYVLGQFVFCFGYFALVAKVSQLIGKTIGTLIAKTLIFLFGKK